MMLVLACSLFRLPLFADDTKLESNTTHQADESSSPTTVASDEPTDVAQRTGKKNSVSYSAFRRMTRYEYNYAMQDMLGLPWDFAKDLPPKAHSEDGFQNSSELWHMSVSQFETHHRLALSRAVTLGDRPKTMYWGVTMKEASRLEWRKQEEQLAKAKETFKDDPGKLQAELKRLEESFRKEHSRSYFRDSTSVHGHNNADQFLTAAATGDGDREYANTISLDQVYASHVGDQTRFAYLVMSTDGGTGTARGAHTISFDKNGRPIPAEHRPKQIFDMLFLKTDNQSAKRLALSRSALDDMLADAKSLKQLLSIEDRKNLDEYMESVRQAEVKVEKAKKWLDAPLPKVDSEHLNLELTTDEPRQYLQTMFEMVYLAFRTDSTRVATYQIGRENGIGRSDHLSRAVGFNLAHQLSHETKNPDGWKNFGIYCRFLNEEFGRFVEKLRNTPEPAGAGSMLDNTLLLYGSASSAFHLSRNYPLMLAGGKNMGFQHGQYINQAGSNFQGGP